MSFLDDIKIYGLVSLLIGIISIVLGVYGAFDGEGGTAYVTGIVPGLMLLIVGWLAYSGQTKGKNGAMEMYLIFVGIGLIIVGALTLNSGIVSIIIGLFAAIIGYCMYINKKLSSFWWIILIIVFLIMVIGALLSVFDIGFDSTSEILRSVSIILTLVMYVFIFYFVLSKEVRNEFR